MGVPSLQFARCGEGLRHLRKRAKRVTNVHATDVVIGIQSMKRIAAEWELEHNEMCVGLAAPQIGWAFQVLLVRKNENQLRVKPTSSSSSAEYKAWERDDSLYDPWYVLVNPTIHVQEGSQDSTEGCMSVPGSSYAVKRPQGIIFTYTQPNGVRMKPTIAKGFGAAVLMHEMDHLRGILVPDHASETIIGKGDGAL